ncbi:hypothetical protein GQ43DRAFT_264735 [Delitschia confertaspora ATCC 74209]|uniref:Uncharacterized protein n=1 Tax=Delitschia confertaspora ATCC 74209 TaxID=1513339 RepID=A0A9P4N136_9PLEO|nr:hypothetical protein GQ43DRAFT_264735 [Delitschia confertaspora ATCC 74209]
MSARFSRYLALGHGKPSPTAQTAADGINPTQAVVRNGVDKTDTGVFAVLHELLFSRDPDADSEEWTDCSTDDALTPEKKQNGVSKSSIVSPFHPVTPEEEKELMPYMPALFHKVLPPCGAEVQIAYLRVVGTLRERWLAKRGLCDILDLCRALKNDLDIQAARFPPGSLRMTKARKPWRRENVFRFEIRWANYMLQEAQLLETPFTDEEELEKRKEDPVPVELHLRPQSPDVLRAWIDWNKIREMKKPTLPGLRGSFAESRNLTHLNALDEASKKVSDDQGRKEPGDPARREASLVDITNGSHI